MRSVSAKEFYSLAGSGSSARNLPLVGGQILRSLSWFACGRARDLLVASALGLAGAACGLAVGGRAKLGRMG